MTLDNESLRVESERKPPSVYRERCWICSGQGCVSIGKFDGLGVETVARCFHCCGMGYVCREVES